MIYLELLLVFLLTVVNGLLAMSELAVVSARPARLRTMADRGSHGARKALALAADPGRFLSSVQIGITLVGIVAGAVSGATLGERLGDFLLEQGVSPRWAYILGVGIVVTLITYLSLIVGELVPTQLALRDPERIAAMVAPAMTTIARIAAPVVWVLDRSGRLILRLLGQSGKSEDRITDEEIHSIVAEAESAGVLEPGERAMIAGVMRLADRPVRQVMTPRFEVVAVDVSAGATAVFNAIRGSSHSRFPVHEGNSDEIIGIVSAKDLLDVGRRAKAADLRAVVRDAPVIPETMDALDAIEVLRNSKVHMGLVHDEYGHFQGIVTSFDILESIVGSFSDEAGEPEPALVPRQDGSLLVSGWMQADDFAAAADMILPEQRDYDTVAGMLIEAFGRLPEIGDHVTIQGMRFEVVDLDGRRIDKIIASREATKPQRRRA